MAKSKIIHLLEEDVSLLVGVEKQRLDEYAISSKDFKTEIVGILDPIFHNLACVAIFHDVNPLIVNHWINRAKQLPTNMFVRKVKSGDRQHPINAAFDSVFGNEFTDIDETWYGVDITYYGSKKGKDKMVADNDASYYFNKYNGLIINVLIGLKEALICRDYKTWIDKVDEFESAVC